MSEQSSLINCRNTMKKTSNNAFTEFRSPNSYELKQISKYFEIYYMAHIKIVKALSRIFCVLGLIFLGAIGFNTERSMISIILGILCFIIVFLCIKTKNNYVNIISEFNNGKYVVMDGIITKMERNPDNMKCVNVWFTSNNGSYNDGWYKIREEFASVGSDIILVYLNSGSSRKPIKMAFTPFMLTDEGIKLQK